MTDPERESFIPIARPTFGRAEEEAVLAVLRSGTIAQGSVVAHFEELCAAMAGTEHAVAVSNGTVALEACLEILGIGPGDEVITSPFTFAATLNVILRRGATARFADIDEDFTVDPAAVESLIGERTRLLLPVHLYGLMADMEALAGIATRHGLGIVEDAAQAHGASQGGRRAGGYGLGCFSFYATKNVTSAEGGVITTDSAGHAERLRILRNQGMRDRYDYAMIGQNWRLTDLAAALAVPQMERLESIIAGRNRNASLLGERLAGDAGITTPRVPAGRTHVWHQYTVLLPDGCDRDHVIAAMRERGVGAGAYYPRLVWDYDSYRDHPGVIAGDTPRAADAARRCLSLPVRPELTEADLERVAGALLEAVRSPRL
jgi:perosamine synthetase